MVQSSSFPREKPVGRSFLPIMWYCAGGGIKVRTCNELVSRFIKQTNKNVPLIVVESVFPWEKGGSEASYLVILLSSSWNGEFALTF